MSCTPCTRCCPSRTTAGSRLEVACPDADPHIPSLFSVYPANDWHERETYDFFGIVFDGHPSLTRIEMPDDWPGHPQRKDYPLGGIPVEYKGAEIPPPRRAEALLPVTTTSGPYDASPTTPPASDYRPLRRLPRDHRGAHLHRQSGGDWDSFAAEAAELGEGHLVVNMGPQHPSTHGVLRLILELEGETVVDARAGIGYLHTGIEKNLEFRTWMQGVTFVTRMDYLSPFFNETAYCMGVEKLLGITDELPERARLIRILLMELNRHLVAPGVHRHRGHGDRRAHRHDVGFRERELVLDLFELVTGLRMNHAFVRPGGVAQDLPRDGHREDPRLPQAHAQADLKDYVDLCNENPIFKGRLSGIGYLDLAGCMALGMTGPCCGPPGCPGTCARPSRTSVTRTSSSTCPPGTPATPTGGSGSGWTRWSSRCASSTRWSTGSSEVGPGPVMVADPKIAWPAQMSIGPDGQGNSPRAHPPHHERVDGGADPPLQAGDRGLPGAGRPGLRAGRVAPRRARPRS